MHDSPISVRATTSGSVPAALCSFASSLIRWVLLLQHKRPVCKGLTGRLDATCAPFVHRWTSSNTPRVKKMATLPTATSRKLSTPAVLRQSQWPPERFSGALAYRAASLGLLLDAAGWTAQHPLPSTDSMPPHSIFTGISPAIPKEVLLRHPENPWTGALVELVERSSLRHAV